MALDQVFKFSVNSNDVDKVRYFEPKPHHRLTRDQVTRMVQDICINVRDNEPGALVYYVYKVECKNEFVAIERSETSGT
jgi:hypothetical protein